MPIQGWSRADAGIFHDFHQAWTIEIRNALNSGALPKDYIALADQSVDGPITDVITLHQSETPSTASPPDGAVAIIDAPPQAKYMVSTEANVYAARANRISIRHHLGRVVAVIEIVSPGNKSSRHALQQFVEKAAQLLRNGINLLVVDLFPPSPRDPQGIHKAVWDTLNDELFELPADKPLTVAAYSAGKVTKAYMEPVAVGDELPSLPIFLSPDTYVSAPLEETYQVTREKCPAPLREYVESLA